VKETAGVVYYGNSREAAMDERKKGEDMDTDSDTELG
jgi:hypothetical protein